MALIIAKILSLAGIGSFIGGLFIKSLPKLGFLIVILAIAETAIVISMGGGYLGFVGSVITTLIAAVITGGVGYGISHIRRSKNSKTN